MKNNKKIWKLPLSIVLCLVAGGIGAYFTNFSVATWYIYLLKPAFTPASWVFAPVWGVLYVLMGISVYLVWAHESFDEKGKDGLYLFFTQLALNTNWSIAFFGFRSILWGFVVIILLWIFILMTIIKFYKISPMASILMIPYILWVSFAAILNYNFLILNR